jgi:FkbM family methyltransferase
VLTVPASLTTTTQAVLEGEYDLPMDTPPRTIGDFGANIGAYSWWISEKYPDAKIQAFEPFAANAELFRKNCPQPNVTLTQAGVRNYDGVDYLHLGARNSSECSFFKVGGQAEDTVAVPVIDAARLPSFDLVKIDTEGAELEILRRLDLRDTRGIAVEYHRREDDLGIRRYLRGKGFYLHDRAEYDTAHGLLKFTKTIRERLFIGVPIYTQPNPFFCNSLVQLLRRPPCHLIFRQTVGDSPVGRSRNLLTADFLETDCSHLLFIDCDLVFSGDHVAHIVSHPEEVVGGLYPKKQQGPVEWVLNTLPGARPKVLDNGLCEVRYVGTGFIRIHRSVFERMIERWGDDIHYKCDSDPDRIEHNLWQIGTYQYPDGWRRYLSEDWFFCQRWLDLGGKVWADTRVVLKHVGLAVYPQPGQIEAAAEQTLKTLAAENGYAPPAAAATTP